MQREGWTTQMDFSDVLSKNYEKSTIIQQIRESADVGRPLSVDDDSDVALIYNEITKKMIKFLVERNKNLPPTEILKIKTMAGCQ